LASLPNEVAAASLPAGGRATSVPVGIAGDDLQPAFVDLSEGHVLIAAPAKSGKTSAIDTIARALAATSTEVVVLRPRRSATAGAVAGVAREAVGVDACEEAAADIESGLDDREASSPLLAVIVDDATLLADGAADSSLEAIAKRGRDLNVVVIVAADPAEASRAYGGVVSEVRRDRHGILLMPDLDVDGDLLNARLPRRASVPMVAGRGYLVERGSIRLVQLAR